MSNYNVEDLYEELNWLMWGPALKFASSEEEVEQIYNRIDEIKIQLSNEKEPVQI